jgi:hypothetical protein
LTPQTSKWSGRRPASRLNAKAAPPDRWQNTGGEQVESREPGVDKLNIRTPLGSP